jgi:O-acetylhomoserine (thiol)-lyase
MAQEQEFKGRCPAGANARDNFATMCLYAGQQPDPISGSRVPAIHQNTGFVFKDTTDAAAKFSLSAFGPIYSRIGNPTCDAVEAKIAALEGGMAALSVASGHAAQMIAFTNLLNSGDNFVSTKQLYGGSVTQFGRQFAQFGWQVRFVDVDDYTAMERAIDNKTKAIYCESLCNPGGIVSDLEKISVIAKKHGLPLIVDNTTATPYLCRPFEWGADIVLHSATKYLSGHGNALCGFIVEKGDFNWGSGKFPILGSPCDSYHGLNFMEVFGKDGPVAEMFGTKGKTGMAFTVACRALGLRDCGPSLSPFNAFLVNMGMETLPLRMEKHCYNAVKVAEFLHSHPGVASVSYSGLSSNKYYPLTQKYTPKGASGLFTFSCKGGFEAAKKVVNAVDMISLVANLGDTRTLIAHPASMMHSQLTEEQQKSAGADPSILRMTIGIEDVMDIIKDLAQALEKAGGGSAPPKAKM